METSTPVVDVEKFIGIFKCIKCRKYVRPDFTSCRKGHVTCESCRNERVCAYCHVKSKQFKNHTLKMIFMSVTFPCNYEDRGCEVKLRGEKIVEHEKHCRFGQYGDSLNVDLERIKIEM